MYDLSNFETMISVDYPKRVRYAETDKMGFLYYGNYPKYYEIGRVELIRSLGYSYKELEDKAGILMPVVSMESRYLKSAYYDDEVIIRSCIKELPTKMICFDHELFVGDQLINKGNVKLFFIDAKTQKRISAPAILLEKLSPHFD